MAITVNYQKRKNINLFNKFQSNPNIALSNVQNYIPIYDKFFSLNTTNFNSINLNHMWSISDIKDFKNKADKDETLEYQHIYTCKLKNISDDEDFTTTQKVFIKMAPLLDPFKYLVGKYNHTDPNLFNLPSIDKTKKVHPKLEDPNNSSYIDGFFSFLTSQVLHKHNFIHGLDYYGSFLAIKNNYKINIIDDIDYLVQSEFFNKQKNKLFTVEDYSHLMQNTIEPTLKPLNIMNISQKSNLSVKSIDDTIFENIFENTNTDTDTDTHSISLDDVKMLNIDLVDITNSIDITDQKKSATLKSGSSCSSRTSHTNDNDTDNDNDNSVSDLIKNDIEDLDDLDCSKSASKSTASESYETNSGSETGSKSNYSESSYETDLEEEKLFLTLQKFPVQVICMENCESTLDELIINTDLSHDEWMSALMQIIMTLITYQKLFSFTHNDLHTNNIMYIPTNKKFLYYLYKKKYYKVPTFGKIFKIIDFGRAIYKFDNKLFCSDSFQTGGDAVTQYNTEPYFNDKKPRLEPNFSFDLCRLACSIFDYIIDDMDSIKNINSCDPIVKLIVEWCTDDNGINVLYKNNGAERYPDFKLYKMIARCVHNHTPNAQLERPEFSKFALSKINLAKGEFVMNIDELPSYC
jgi:hypothetical protein